MFSPGVTAGECGTSGLWRYFVKVMLEEYGGHISFEPDEPPGTLAVRTFERAMSGDGTDEGQRAKK